MPDSLLGRLFARLTGGGNGGRDADAVRKLEQQFAQFDKKLDRLTKRNEDDRLILRRVSDLLEQGRAPGADGPDLPEATPAPLRPSTREDWVELSACPICGHGTATLVSEYNRFLLADAAPDESSKIYNYSLCHGCGIVYAARRPVGRRFRELLSGFHENLGRVGTPSAWLNPGTLSEGDREHIRSRAKLGALVSEHTGVNDKEWIPGALSDRLATSQHVVLLASLLTLQKPRVLEVRSRSGAMLDALRRLYGASGHALPIFESQQEVVKALYGIPADALIDFEHFEIPYDGPFDLIISNHMLTHSVKPGDYLDTISAALAPGGHLYLYNEMDEAEFLGETRSMFNVFNPFHLQIFSPMSLTRALAARGFEVVFLGHTDRIHMMCLARKAAPVQPTIPKGELKKRQRQYAAARDLSILALPDDRRAVFSAEWDQVVERAVLSGMATVDERGRIQFRRARRKPREAEAGGEIVG